MGPINPPNGKTWFDMIVRLGTTAVLALLGFWFLSTVVTAKLNNIEAMVSSAKQEMSTYRTSAIYKDELLIQAVLLNQSILKQICFNGAKTTEAMQACAGPR